MSDVKGNIYSLLKKAYILGLEDEPSDDKTSTEEPPFDAWYNLMLGGDLNEIVSDHEQLKQENERLKCALQMITTSKGSSTCDSGYSPEYIASFALTDHKQGEGEIDET
jgi:hypothetical protein